jgi:hypothetical protein
MTTPTQFTWTDPTTNADGSSLTAGEITGYTIGIRSTTAAGSVVGTYPVLTSIVNPTATSEALSSLSTVLVADTYAAAIRSDGPVTSVWTNEVTFTIAAAVPNPPSNFTVA